MFLLIFLIIFLPITVHSAVLPPEDCFGCHDTYKNTRHGNVTCTDCHRNIQDLPHNEKVEKPACAQCHNKVQSSYTKSVHALKNMKCADCHDTHSPSREKKNCQQCHTDLRHQALPSAKKHLSALSCGACHGDTQKSSIDVSVAIKKGKPLTKGSVDLDSNNILDKKEWNNLLSLLQKGTYKIDTKYSAKGDIHSVKKQGISCNACHTDGALFKKALLKVSGAVSFEIPVEPKAFIPGLPSIEQFTKALHGRKGVTCSDCHASQAKVTDQVCITCHSTTYNVYKNTSHASSGATACTDCHNPHSITAYKELNVRERLNICARCHQDYLTKHSWLPNTTLHFNYLECSTCHSPKSTKSIAFYFSCREGNTNRTLTYEDMKIVFADTKDITSLIDTNKDRSIVSQELSNFFMELKRRLKKDLFIGGSLINTKVHHDYSSKRTKERVCSTCHSEDAPFYESMYLIVPEEKGQVYIPVKGTTLGAWPISLFIDFCLLGEEKIKERDITNFFSMSGQGRSDFIKGLGFKWIDACGIALIIIALLGILLHIIGRIIWRR
jgi:predicted CXXCH cytochrome family protein